MLTVQLLGWTILYIALIYTVRMLYEVCIINKSPSSDHLSISGTFYFALGGANSDASVPFVNYQWADALMDTDRYCWSSHTTMSTIIIPIAIKWDDVMCTCIVKLINILLVYVIYTRALSTASRSTILTDFCLGESQFHN